jgi:uncharacterized membrane protein
MIAATAIQAIFILLLPLGVVYLCKRIKWFRFLGPLLLCYILGLLIGTLPIGIQKDVASLISEISIVLAIPLILFNCDFIRWLSSSNKTVLSFSLLVISVAVVSVILGLIFNKWFDEAWNIAGMLTGCYTGGTPNLVAIGLGLKVDKDVMAMVIASDTVIGGLYYFMLLAFGIRLTGKFLKPYDGSNKNRLAKMIVYEYSGSAVQAESRSNDVFTKSISIQGKLDSVNEAAFSNEFDQARSENSSYIQQLMNNKKTVVVNIIRVCLLAIISAGASIGLAYLITGEMSVVFIMLGVTTLGIAFSLLKKVNSTPQAYKIGEYLIFVFSFALALTIDITTIIRMPSIYFVYTALIMFGSIILHFVLAKVFNIDRDTAIITSTAGIYGPAFIPPVVSALKNDEVLITGLSSGLVGYAIGNYLGFFIAAFIKLLVS